MNYSLDSFVSLDDHMVVVIKLEETEQQLFAAQREVMRLRAALKLIQGSINKVLDV